VVGYEPNADYFAAAQQVAAQSHLITVNQGGFAQIDAAPTYDLIAAINNPFAYLLTPTNRADALQRMFCALKPGGVLFLDLFNFLWKLRFYRPPQDAVLVTESGDTLRRVIRYDIDWHDSTVTHTDTFYRADQYLTSQSHRMAIITPQELLHQVAAAGFQHIQTYNNYAARQSQRIYKDRIMVSAQKPF
jgi:hypothetical protein